MYSPRKFCEGSVLQSKINVCRLNIHVGGGDAVCKWQVMLCVNGTMG